MEDITLIKFGGEANAMSIGGKNPAAVAAALMLFSGPELGVSQAQDVQAQNIGNQLRSSGIQVG